jgi:hypothetical protein
MFDDDVLFAEGAFPVGIVGTEESDAGASCESREVRQGTIGGDDGLEGGEGWDSGAEGVKDEKIGVGTDPTC